MKFFKPEDFEGVKIYPHKESCEELSRLCNFKLERDGKIGYSYFNDDRFIISGNESQATHKSLIINIERIEPCRHTPDKVYVKFETYPPKSLIPDNTKKWFQCVCGKIVNPIGFE